MLLSELVKIRENGSKYVSARDLHEWIGSKEWFDRWNNQNLLNASYKLWKFINFDIEIPKALKNLKFEVEDVSKEVQQVQVKLAKNKGTNFENKKFIDYELSLRIASHLAMISKCEKGEEARDYFYNVEKLYYEQVENNLKLGSMLLTHKDKLNLTKEVFYPILDKLGVLSNKRNEVHKRIIKSIFGKYENVNKLNKISEEDIENYKTLAESMKDDTRFFVNHDQIAIWDLINEI